MSNFDTWSRMKKDIWNHINSREEISKGNLLKVMDKTYGLQAGGLNYSDIYNEVLSALVAAKIKYNKIIVA